MEWFVQVQARAAALDTGLAAVIDDGRRPVIVEVHDIAHVNGLRMLRCLQKHKEPALRLACPAITGRRQLERFGSLSMALNQRTG